MFCKNCGAKIEEGMNFCNQCGAKVDSIADTKKDYLESRVQPKKKGKLIIIIVCIALLIGGGVGAYFYLHKDKSTKDYDVLISEAEDYLEDLDYDQAVAKYLEAIEVNPKFVEPYVEVAKIYVIEEKYEDAVNILNDALEYANESETEEINDMIDDYNSYINGASNADLSEVLEAYADYLTNQGAETFCLLYFDSDDIPELCIPEGDFHASCCTVYQYQDGEVVELFTDGVYGQIGYLEKQGIGYVNNTSMGYQYLYLFDKDGIIHLISDNFFMLSDSFDGFEGSVDDITYTDYNEYQKAVYDAEYFWISEGGYVELNTEYYDQLKYTTSYNVNSAHMDDLRNGDFEQFLSRG